MAFLIVSGSVTSYAEYTDVVQRDQRLFEENVVKLPAESEFVDVQDFIEDLLIKSTARINAKIKASTWWQGYLNYTGTTVTRPSDVPDFDPDKILSRKSEFTDACVYYALKEYILPLVADFSTEENAEVQKIRYYEDKFSDLFQELLALADWYDADDDGNVDSSEKAFSYQQVRRSRRRSSVIKVR